MPNHTSNRLEIQGPIGILEEIKRNHFDKSGTLDLNTIVPMPEEIRNTAEDTDSYRARQVLAGNVSWLNAFVAPGIEVCHTREEIFEFLKNAGDQNLVDLAVHLEHLSSI